MLSWVSQFGITGDWVGNFMHCQTEVDRTVRNATDKKTFRKVRRSLLWNFKTIPFELCVKVVCFENIVDWRLRSKEPYHTNSHMPRVPRRGRELGTNVSD